jgi:hypothetical protein
MRLVRGEANVRGAVAMTTSVTTTAATLASSLAFAV